MTTLVTKKINEALRAAGVSRARLAERINMDQSYLQKMLTNKRPLRLDVLEDIANALAMPVWELLKEQGGERVHLGVLEMPLIRPETLLNMARGAEMSMDHVVDVVSLPRAGALGCETDHGKLVAVTLPDNDNEESLFIVNPHDREPDENGLFVCYYDNLPAKFAVGRVITQGDHLICYGKMHRRPFPVEGIVARVLWKLECYAQNS